MCVCRRTLRGVHETTSRICVPTYIYIYIYLHLRSILNSSASQAAVGVDLRIACAAGPGRTIDNDCCCCYCVQQEKVFAVNQIHLECPLTPAPIGMARGRHARQPSRNRSNNNNIIATRTTTQTGINLSTDQQSAKVELLPGKKIHEKSTHTHLSYVFFSLIAQFRPADSAVFSLVATRK